MGAFSPYLQRTRRGDPASAFDPHFGQDDAAEPVQPESSALRPAQSSPDSATAPPSAFTPTLLRSGETARSATGGGYASAAMSPSHPPITSPRSQTEADLMDTEQKIAAFQPKPLGFWKGAAAAYLPVLGPHFTGDYQNEYNVRKADELTKIVNAQRQMEQSEAYSNYMLGRNPTNLAVAGQRNVGVKNRVESQLNEKGLAGEWDENGNLTDTHPLPASGLSIPATADVNLKNAQADKAEQGPKLNDFEQFYKDYLDSNNVTDSARTRLAARREYSAAGQPQTGTLSLQEDAQGNPVLFNSKTGQVKPAGGIQKSGTKAKNDAASVKLTEPVDTALQYADDYLKNGVHTGPGDEALQEKFFELAKPATGFRMTQPQMDMLQNSRSWMQSARAHIRHTTSGTWFDDDQRAQIVNAMKDLGNAKKSALKGGSGGAGAGSGAGANGSAPPANLLKEGVHTTFKNGQTWTLQNGQPEQVQ